MDPQKKNFGKKQLRGTPRAGEIPPPKPYPLAGMYGKGENGEGRSGSRLHPLPPFLLEKNPGGESGRGGLTLNPPRVWTASWLHTAAAPRR